MFPPLRQVFSHAASLPAGRNQLRVACQRPLQFPPDNFAVHRPEPEPLPSLPVPLATAPPAEILT
jgi:hypothetical protein